MQSLSISGRINAGFFSITAILIAVCVATFTVVSLLGDTFQSYRGTAKQTMVMSNFAEDLFEARIGSLNYQLAPSDAAMAEVEDNIAEIVRDVGSQKNLLTDPADLARLNELAALSTQYLNDFHQMADARLRTRDAHDAVFEVATNVRGALSELRDVAAENQSVSLLRAQSVAQESTLSGEIFAVSFSMSEDGAARDSALREFETAEQALGAARTALGNGIGRSWHGGAIAQIDLALNGLIDLKAALAEMGHAIDAFVQLRDGSLNQIGPAMQDNLENWTDAVVARQDTHGRQGEEIVASTQFLTPLIGLAALLLSVGVAFVVARWITKPIVRLADTTTSLADGDVNVVIHGVEQTHELGRMARALEVFREAHIEREQMTKLREQQVAVQEGVVAALSNGLTALAAGRLDVRIDEDFGKDYETLRENFNSALMQLEKSMSGVIAASTQIDTNAGLVNAASDELSNRTENQAAALEETAAALDQLTASVRSSAERASEVATTMGATRANAKESGEVVVGAVKAMAMIEASSTEISQIASVISDISFQTNLLALNAGVEAARAGDAGRGFAVVASEVRQLAQRSSQAAREVADLISKSSGHVANGTKLINDAGSALDTVIEKIDHVSQLIEEIASNATEQAAGISEINIGVSQLDQVTQKNAAMVVASGQQGADLASEARRLKDLVRVFKLSHQGGTGAARFDGPVRRMMLSA